MYSIITAYWQFWEDNNMEWESTMGYAKIGEFRCGICYDFLVFNFMTQQKLDTGETFNSYG